MMCIIYNSKLHIFLIVMKCGIYSGIYFAELIFLDHYCNIFKFKNFENIFNILKIFNWNIIIQEIILKNKFYETSHESKLKQFVSNNHSHSIAHSISLRTFSCASLTLIKYVYNSVMLRILKYSLLKINRERSYYGF